MKNTLLLIAVLLAGACATTSTMKSVAGTYEVKVGENTVRMVLLENGNFEGCINDKQDLEEGKWSISEEGELHCVDEDDDIGVFKINGDGGITWIAEIDTKGKRTDWSKEEQYTWKRIK